MYSWSELDSPGVHDHVYLLLSSSTECPYPLKWIRGHKFFSTRLLTAESAAIEK